MSLMKKAVAECIGTFVLVVFGCGIAVVSSNFFPEGFLVATALAFGLSIVAMAYSIGNISGCHINPAVSLGVFIYNKLTHKDGFGLKELGVYVAAQFVGAILGALLLEAIFSQAGIANLALGSNTVSAVIGGQTAAGYGLGFLAEVVLTFAFVLAILGVTSKEGYSGQAGIVIGLTLTLVHLLGIGLTGTSVNPARSFGPALIALMNGATEPIKEIWIFLIAPLIGAAIAAVLYAYLTNEKAAKAEAEVK
jgi:aquaporin Z